MKVFFLYFSMYYLYIELLAILIQTFFIFIFWVFVAVDALIIIKTDLNDPHGVLNNWDEDSVDPCSWAMITCSPENVVVGLWVFLFLVIKFDYFKLFSEICFYGKNNQKWTFLGFCRGAPSQSLSGTLSGAIGNLTNLRQVYGD